MSKNIKELEAEIVSLTEALQNKTNSNLKLRAKLEKYTTAFNAEVRKHDAVKEDLYNAKHRISELENQLAEDVKIHQITELEAQITKLTADVAKVKQDAIAAYKRGVSEGEAVGEHQRMSLEAGIRQAQIECDNVRRMNAETNQLNLMILTKHGEWMEEKTRQKMLAERQAEIQKLLPAPAVDGKTE